MPDTDARFGFTHDTPRLRTVLTRDTGALLRGEMEQAGLRRALILCSPRLAAGPFGRRVRQALEGFSAGLFQTASHPSLAEAESGAAMARREDADCLVALGGGGASDLAKGIALQLADAGRQVPISAADIGRPPGAASALGAILPIFAVPTTASGAELTSGFGQRDASGRKVLFRDARLFVRLIVLDPSAMAETPPPVLVPTCMNAIAHCVEALYSRARDPISESHAVSGLTLLDRGLRRLHRDGAEEPALRDLLVGANLAGRAIVNARTGLHHAVCHVLGAAGLPHGIANTIVLPHAVAFNAEAAGEALEPAAAVLGQTEGVSAAEAIVAAVDRHGRRFGLPRRLRDAGLDRALLPGLAEQVTREPGMRFNPRQLAGAAEVLDLLRAAW